MTHSWIALVACLSLAACDDGFGEHSEHDGSSPDASDGEQSNDIACLDANAGVQLDFGVALSSANEFDNVVLTQIPCVAGQILSQLTCTTAPEVSEEIGLKLDGLGQPLPWAAGDDLRLTLAWDFDIGFGIDNRTVVVRSATDELLLAISERAPQPAATHIAPLSVALDTTQCAPSDTEDAEFLTPASYTIDNVSADLIGNDQAVLETPRASYELLQQESRYFNDNHQVIHLTFSMVRITP